MAEFGQLTLTGDTVPASTTLAGDACRHTPHALWNWRCEKCDAVLCTTCQQEAHSGKCRKGASHGRAP